MENIVIEEKRSKAVQLSFLGLLMTIISAAIWVFGVKEHSFLYSAIGIMGTIFFGICTIYIFSRTINSKPLLTITMEGIEDTSSAGSYGFIPYSDMKKIEAVNVFGQRVIGITLKDFDTFSKRLSPVKMKTAKSCVRMNLPPISIRVDTAKDMTLEDIVSLLEKRLSDYSSLYD